MINEIITAFITMAVLMDPLGNIPAFLGLASGYDERHRKRAALHAVLVAFVLIFGFALGGRAVLNYLHVSLQALTVAGGLLLALISLEMLRGHFDDPDVSERGNIALVPLGTPLIAGPGAIVATMVLLDSVSDVPERIGVAIGIALALLAVWVALRLSVPIARHLPESIIHLLSRIMGLLLAGIAVQMVFNGTRDWIQLFG
ncbi:MAG TPA: MarC family protein [Miltoncostaeales bacterium]|jgi:multiple antibiotic resistance protein|nr:MarC family protein [Miltoncostaeales bacterium]